MKSFALCVALLAFATAAVGNTFAKVDAATGDPVRTLDRPYVRPQPPQSVEPSTTLGQQRFVARPAAPASFSLLLTDQDVGRAFARWARDRRLTVRWLLGRELPIDAAVQQVAPDPDDLRAAADQGSADPEMAAAMVKVARAFARSRYPFVVREYDNAYVIEPKSGSRQ